MDNKIKWIIHDNAWTSRVKVYKTDVIPNAYYYIDKLSGRELFVHINECFNTELEARKEIVKFAKIIISVSNDRIKQIKNKRGQNG